MKKIDIILAFLFLFGFSLNAQTAETLFAKDDLSEWTMFVDDANVNPASVYKLTNGILRIEGQPFGFIRTNKRYENYVLMVQWRWVDAPSNSGIFIHVQSELKRWPNAIECQLGAGRAGEIVLLGGADLASYEAPQGQPRPNFPIIPKKNDSNEKPVGEWNTAVIVSMNGYITIMINGILQNEGAGPMHRSGHIALQSEGGPIEFRNMTLLTLPK
jgi:hypothetical protein